MKKFIVTLCIVTIVSILILTSFNPVIGYLTVKNSQNKITPLFTVRINHFKNLQSSTLKTNYIGKNSPINFDLPTRNIINDDMILELSKVNIHKKIGKIDNDVYNKWNFVLKVAKNNLAAINEILREESVELKNLIDKYFKLSDEELKQIFLNNLNRLNLQEYSVLSLYSHKKSNNGNTNITSGFFCNITSGSICSITSQPICELTSQPICDFITILPPCLTLMGLRCPSVGLKCNSPPTTGKICDILTQLGPLLKAVAFIVIIALIIFIPLIMIVSVLNSNACSNIRDQITYMFNCTSPE